MTKHRVWHLRGGIYPPENKAQSLQQPIRSMPLPAQLIVPLQQYIGSPAIPCVSIGQYVFKGQLIANSPQAISAPVHAPSSGIITQIGQHPVIHPSPLEQPCITIDLDGKDTWIAHQGSPDYAGQSQDDLLLRIRAAGIIGLGGAGFPTAAKLHTSGQKIKTLIINGAECEPYITTDDILMRERAADIVTGIQVIAHILQPEEIFIGIEDNKTAAITQMEQATLDTGIEVVVIPTQYPSGGERQLIKILTGKEVPADNLIAQSGVIVQNIGTAYSIFEAIVHGKPLISRVTTLSGQALGTPGNVEALIGTPIKHLLHHAGLDAQQVFRIIVGGPMMGFSLISTELPLSKTTNCLIAATRDEMPPPPPEQDCIRCGLCADVCPVTLLPQQLYFFSKSQELDKAEQHNIFDCIECGACAYVCPSHIPLVQYYRHTKGSIEIQNNKENKSGHARRRFENRNARLQQEENDKIAKRQARINTVTVIAPVTNQTLSAENNAMEIARLKTAAATSAKLAVDAKKALIQAERKQAQNLDSLREQVETLQKNAEQARQQLLKAQETETPSEAAAASHSANTATLAAPQTSADKIAAALARNEARKIQQERARAVTSNSTESKLAHPDLTAPNTAEKASSTTEKTQNTRHPSHKDS